MKREDVLPYISFYVDDAGHASDTPPPEIKLDDARLVGYQCGFEPLVVAVYSYLPNVRLNEADAEELARDYLEERKWFAGENRDADFIL